MIEIIYQSTHLESMFSHILIFSTQLIMYLQKIIYFREQKSCDVNADLYKKTEENRTSGQQTWS